MLDVKAVGANLTPEQQEATLADLNFFLDEFGSTRAVRVKLQEQQRDIQRLGGQVRRLVNGRGEDEHDKRDDEITVESNQSDPNGVDEIMADVDFFLRAYGSTRAVRHELYAQRQKLANLQSTIRYFQKRQGLNRIMSRQGVPAVQKPVISVKMMTRWEVLVLLLWCKKFLKMSSKTKMV
ncbi:Phosducin protein 3 [Phytophthora nicotianae]|uniref:Phosducin protein 3 n=1 Tax=Phytophthora nicotianae TaxID=4792 RepID=A0A0W8DRM7_PHYNI|nr:Phosducin protein 3 [Phytophthora nicotianae]